MEVELDLADSATGRGQKRARVSVSVEELPAPDPRVNEDLGDDSLLLDYSSCGSLSVSGSSTPTDGSDTPPTVPCSSWDTAFKPICLDDEYVSLVLFSSLLLLLLLFAFSLLYSALNLTRSRTSIIFALDWPTIKLRHPFVAWGSGRVPT